MKKERRVLGLRIPTVVVFLYLAFCLFGIDFVFGQTQSQSSSKTSMSSSTQQEYRTAAIADFRVTLEQLMRPQFRSRTRVDSERLLNLYPTLKPQEKQIADAEINRFFKNRMKDEGLSSTNFNDFIQYMTGEIPSDSMIAFFMLYAQADIKTIDNNGVVIKPTEVFATHQADRDDLIGFLYLLTKHRGMSTKIILESTQDRKIRKITFYAIDGDLMFYVDGNHYYVVNRKRYRIIDYKDFLLEYKPDVYYASEVNKTVFDQAEVKNKDVYPEKEVFSYLRIIHAARRK